MLLCPCRERSDGNDCEARSGPYDQMRRQGSPMERTKSGGTRERRGVSGPLRPEGLVCLFVFLSLGVPLFVFFVGTFMKAKQRHAQFHRQTSAPVTYVSYTIPFSDLASEMEADYVWITAPDPDEKNANAVFASNMFWFETGQGGYMGTQVWRAGVTDEKWGFLFGGDVIFRIIFAIWDGDNGTNQQAMPGTDAVSAENCERFGGEGTGAHCFIHYEFKLGRAVGVRTRHHGRSEDESGDFWSGTAFDPITGREDAIGMIFVPDKDGHRGFGQMQPWNSRKSFLEYYDATGCHNQAFVEVALRGPWFNDRSITPTECKAEYENECVHEAVASCAPEVSDGLPCAVLQAGGTIQRPVSGVGVKGTIVWGS